jgi:hypothetical protein
MDAMPPPPHSFMPDEPVTITLTAQEWNNIVAALMDAPYRVAAPILGKINAQSRTAHEPPAETETSEAVEK